MRITAITLENFKGIKGPVRIELKPVTLLFGPNSSGKSTIIQALHYAKEIFERNNVNADRTYIGNESINLGGFESLVHNHDKSLPIKLRFDLDLQDSSLPDYGDYNTTEYIRHERNLKHERKHETLTEYEKSLWNISEHVKTASIEIVISWSYVLNKPLLNSYSIDINGEFFSKIELSTDGKDACLTLIDSIHSIFLDGMNREEAIELIKEDIKYFENENSELPLSDKQPGHFWGEFTEIIYFETKDVHNGLVKISCLLDNLSGSALPLWEKSLSFNWRSLTSGDYVPYMVIQHVLTTLIVGPGELVRNHLKELCYIGPIREIPDRNFEPIKTIEKSRWANGLAAWDVLFSEDKEFIEKVNYWLNGEDNLASNYMIFAKEYKEFDINNPEAISILKGVSSKKKASEYLNTLINKKRILIWDVKNKIELKPMDIGVGISQVIPVIVASLKADNDFVIIEQPELHLHPAGQVALGDLFIEQINENRNKTFVLETHSEHLMLRILRRVSETGERNQKSDKLQLTPELLSIYFSEQSDDGLIYTKIRVNEEGDFIDHWPHGFFCERIEELF